MQLLIGLGERTLDQLGLRQVGLAAEVDDLDGLAAGKNHALHEVRLFVVAFHLIPP